MELVGELRDVEGDDVIRVTSRETPLVIGLDVCGRLAACPAGALAASPLVVNLCRVKTKPSGHWLVPDRDMPSALNGAEVTTPALLSTGSVLTVGGLSLQYSAHLAPRGEQEAVQDGVPSRPPPKPRRLRDGSQPDQMMDMSSTEEVASTQPQGPAKPHPQTHTTTQSDTLPQQPNVFSDDSVELSGSQVSIRRRPRSSSSSSSSEGETDRLLAAVNTPGPPHTERMSLEESRRELQETAPTSAPGRPAVTPLIRRRLVPAQPDVLEDEKALAELMEHVSTPEQLANTVTSCVLQTLTRLGCSLTIAQLDTVFNTTLEYGNHGEQYLLQYLHQYHGVAGDAVETERLLLGLTSHMLHATAACAASLSVWLSVLAALPSRPAVLRRLLSTSAGDNTNSSPRTSALLQGCLALHRADADITRLVLQVLTEVAAATPTDLSQKLPLREGAIDLLTSAVRYHDEDVDVVRNILRLLVTMTTTYTKHAANILQEVGERRRLELEPALLSVCAVLDHTRVTCCPLLTGNLSDHVTSDQQVSSYITTLLRIFQEEGDDTEDENEESARVLRVSSVRQAVSLTLRDAKKWPGVQGTAGAEGDSGNGDRDVARLLLSGDYEEAKKRERRSCPEQKLLHDDQFSIPIVFDTKKDSHAADSASDSDSDSDSETATWQQHVYEEVDIVHALITADDGDVMEEEEEAVVNLEDAVNDGHTVNGGDDVTFDDDVVKDESVVKLKQGNYVDDPIGEKKILVSDGDIMENGDIAKSSTAGRDVLNGVNNKGLINIGAHNGVDQIHEEKEDNSPKRRKMRDDRDSLNCQADRDSELWSGVPNDQYDQAGKWGDEDNGVVSQAMNESPSQEHRIAKTEDGENGCLKSLSSRNNHVPVGCDTTNGVSMQGKFQKEDEKEGESDYYDKVKPSEEITYTCETVSTDQVVPGSERLVMDQPALNILSWEEVEKDLPSEYAGNVVNQPAVDKGKDGREAKSPPRSYWARLKDKAKKGFGQRRRKYDVQSPGMTDSYTDNQDDDDDGNNNVQPIRVRQLDDTNIAQPIRVHGLDESSYEVITSCEVHRLAGDDMHHNSQFVLDQQTVDKSNASGDLKNGTCSSNDEVPRERRHVYEEIEIEDDRCNNKNCNKTSDEPLYAEVRKPEACNINTQNKRILSPGIDIDNDLSSLSSSSSSSLEDVSSLDDFTMSMTMGGSTRLPQKSNSSAIEEERTDSKNDEIQDIRGSAVTPGGKLLLTNDENANATSWHQNEQATVETRTSKTTLVVQLGSKKPIDKTSPAKRQMHILKDSAKQGHLPTTTTGRATHNQEDKAELRPNTIQSTHSPLHGKSGKKHMEPWELASGRFAYVSVQTSDEGHRQTALVMRRDLEASYDLEMPVHRTRELVYSLEQPRARPGLEDSSSSESEHEYEDLDTVERMMASRGGNTQGGRDGDGLNTGLKRDQMANDDNEYGPAEDIYEQYDDSKHAEIVVENSEKNQVNTATHREVSNLKHINENQEPNELSSSSSSDNEAEATPVLKKSKWGKLKAIMQGKKKTPKQEDGPSLTKSKSMWSLSSKKSVPVLDKDKSGSVTNLEVVKKGKTFGLSKVKFTSMFNLSSVQGKGEGSPDMSKEKHVSVSANGKGDRYSKKSSPVTKARALSTNSNSPVQRRLDSNLNKNKSGSSQSVNCASDGKEKPPPIIKKKTSMSKAKSMGNLNLISKGTARPASQPCPPPPPGALARKKSMSATSLTKSRWQLWFGKKRRDSGQTGKMSDDTSTGGSTAGEDDQEEDTGTRVPANSSLHKSITVATMDDLNSDRPVTADHTLTARPSSTSLFDTFYETDRAAYSRRRRSREAPRPQRSLFRSASPHPEPRLHDRTVDFGEAQPPAPVADETGGFKRSFSWLRRDHPDGHRTSPKHVSDSGPEGQKSIHGVADGVEGGRDTLGERVKRNSVVESRLQYSRDSGVVQSEIRNDDRKSKRHAVYEKSESVQDENSEGLDQCDTGSVNIVDDKGVGNKPESSLVKEELLDTSCDTRNVSRDEILSQDSCESAREFSEDGVHWRKLTKAEKPPNRPQTLTDSHDLQDNKTGVTFSHIHSNGHNDMANKGIGDKQDDLTDSISAECCKTFPQQTYSYPRSLLTPSPPAPPMLTLSTLPQQDLDLTPASSKDIIRVSPAEKADRSRETVYYDSQDQRVPDRGTVYHDTNEDWPDNGDAQVDWPGAVDSQKDWPDDDHSSVEDEEWFPHTETLDSGSSTENEDWYPRGHGSPTSVDGADHDESSTRGEAGTLRRTWRDVMTELRVTHATADGASGEDDGGAAGGS